MRPNMAVQKWEGQPFGRHLVGSIPTWAARHFLNPCPFGGASFSGKTLKGGGQSVFSHPLYLQPREENGAITFTMVYLYLDVQSAGQVVTRDGAGETFRQRGAPFPYGKQGTHEFGGSKLGTLFGIPRVQEGAIVLTTPKRFPFW